MFFRFRFYFFFVLFTFGTSLLYAKPETHSGYNGDEEEFDPEAAKRNDNTISDLSIQSGDRPGQVLLNWKVKSFNKSPIVIKRFSRPMSTIRIFNKGTIITKRALRGSTSYYIDKNVPEGVHYYAVVTEEELNAPEILNLTNGNNYTQNPFIVTRQRDPVLNVSQAPRIPETEEIIKRPPTNLNAINTSSAVILSWAPGQVGELEIKYLIYRSSEALNTKDAYKNAKLLGSSIGGRAQFIDKAPLINKTVYYGVVIEGEMEKPDFTDATVARSFIEHRFSKSLEIVELKASNTQNSVILSWSALKLGKNQKYQIFRSKREWENISNLRQSEIIGTTSYKIHNFTDTKPIANQEVFYAVMVVNKDGSPNPEATQEEDEGEDSNQRVSSILTRKLILNQTYIKHRFQKSSDLEFLKAKIVNRNILLNWSALPLSSDDRYLVFKTETEPTDPSTLSSLTPISKTSSKVTSYTDKNPILNKVMYYVVAVSNADGEIITQELNLGRNVVKVKYKRKLIIQKIKARNTDTSVILSWTPVALYENEKYNIYRSTRNFTTKTDFENADLLGHASRKLNEFEDTNPIPNQEVYYAILVVNEEDDKQENEAELLTGWSYIKHTFIKGYEVSEMIATNTSKSVILTWSPVHLPSDERNERYQIFRSFRPLDSSAAVATAEVLGSTSGRIPQFEDLKPILNKEVYYGVGLVSYINSKNFNGLIFNKSFISHTFKGNIVKKKEIEKLKTIEKIDDVAYLSNELDRILAATYFKNKNEQCINQVYSFINRVSEKVEGVQAKATFFLGLCHVKTKSYKKAVKLFSAPSVKKYYPQRAQFWFERTVELMDK